jgi:DNA repair protein RecN (Recombination protein N)
LRRLADAQLTLHGQSRHLILATPKAQRRFLDDVALPVDLRKDLAAAWDSLGAACEATRVHAQRMQEGALQLDLLSFQLGEIETIAPQSGEDEALRKEERRLATHQERAGLVEDLLQDLVEGDTATVTALAGIQRRLEALASLDPELQPLVTRLTGATLEIEELAVDIRHATPVQEIEPGRLEAIQVRLQALQGLCRKYGGTLEEVAARAATLRQAIAEMTDGEETARRLQEREMECAAVFHELALQASGMRRSTARSLSRDVTTEIQALNLSGARLQIKVDASPPEAGSAVEPIVNAGGRHGYDRVIFTFTANRGEPLRELTKVASGGELSRLMLALTLAVEESGQAQEPRTFIFDEVDSGVGGDTAAAVGERLRRAAAAHQIICVTHLPQIAALAAHHLQVTKTISKGRAGTHIQPLPEPDRVTELARMLGGGLAPETAERHARGLLAAAANEKGSVKTGVRRKSSGGRRTQWA